MKQEYERPSMEVIAFSSEDVIICSDTNETELDIN